jgi:hypothetical protein
MVRAVMMTKEQIVELVEIARRNEILWTNLKDREVNQFNEDGSAKLPSLTMLVEDFVKQERGLDHNFDTGSLIIQLRYQTRKELGLPV